MSVQSPQGAAPQKKGMGPLGWILIGCGVVLVIIMIAMVSCGFFVKRFAERVKKNPAAFAAELAVKANPDLEMVSSDPDAGTMTVKNKKTGETVTLNFEDIKEGKFKFKTDKGETTMEVGGEKEGGGGFLKVTGADGKEATFSAGGNAPAKLPSWIPEYPGGAMHGTFDATSSEGHTGAVTVETGDSVAQVIAFYESKLKAEGLKITKVEMGAGSMVTGTSDDSKRSVNVTVSTENGKTQALVSFNDKG